MTLDARSKHLRRLIIRALDAGRFGHPGPAFSLVEILRVLYDDVMKYDPANPKWEGRDRFILSKGHGYLALYALLADKGFIPESELDNFGKAGALLGVHPSRHIPGVEMDTGSLGHGLSIGAGLAKALPDRRVYVVMGDGECDEGSVWEAALYAAKHRLKNLTVLIDRNGMQASGETEKVQPIDSLSEKWKSFDWATQSILGHNTDTIRNAIRWSFTFWAMPQVILCHTVKGKGVAAIENNPAWHHRNNLTDAEIKMLEDGLEAC